MRVIRTSHVPLPSAIGAVRACEACGCTFEIEAEGEAEGTPAQPTAREVAKGVRTVAFSALCPECQARVEWSVTIPLPVLVSDPPRALSNGVVPRFAVGLVLEMRRVLQANAGRIYYPADKLVLTQLLVAVEDALSRLAVILPDPEAEVDAKAICAAGWTTLPREELSCPPEDVPPGSA